jgi:hemerythrin-like domain-containing protein
VIAVEHDPLVEPLDGEALGRLAGEHHRLAESAAALEALIAHLEDDSATRAFLAHLSFVHEFCELLHFPLEDALLEIVLEAGLTPSERRIVFLNLAQHQQMYADALSVLEHAGQGQAPGGRDFRAHAETYVRLLRGHLEFETRHLQPLLRRHITSRDAPRLASMLRDLLTTLAGKPLERLAALEAASRVAAPS